MDNSSLTLAARPTFVSSGEPVFRLMYLILVSIATTFGNLLVLVAILKFKALRRATNAMLGSLAVADLLVGTVTVPLYILWTAKPGVFDESLFMCGFVLFSCLLVVTASQLNLLVMSVEHYLAVCWPLRHRDVLIRCPWLHAVAVSVIWILSLLTTVLSSFAFNKDTKTCSYYGSFDKTFLFSASIAGIFFPFIAIIVLNIKVLYEVKEHDKRRSVSVDRPSGRYRNSVSSFYSSKTDPSSESNKGDQELSSSHKATCLKKSKKPRRQRSFGKYTHVNIEEDNESSVFYPSNPKQSPIFESKSHVSRSRTRTSAPISLKRKTGLESLSFNTGGYPIDSVFTTPVTTTIATTATLTTNATQSTTLTLGSRSSSSGDQGYADVSDNSDSNNDTSIVCDMGADGSFHTKSQNDSPNAKDKTQVTRNSLDGDPYNIKSKMVPIDKTQLPHKLTGEDETLISVMNTFESIPKDEKQNINFLFTTNDGDKKSDGQEIEPKYDKNENKIAFYLFKDSIEADVLPESENESNLYEDLRLETLTGSPISCCNHKEVSPEHTEATPICRIPHSYSDSTCLVCHETVNVQAHPSSLSKGDTCSADQVNVGTPFKHQDNGQSKPDEFDTEFNKQNQDVKTHHGSIKRKIHQEKVMFTEREAGVLDQTTKAMTNNRNWGGSQGHSQCFCIAA